MANWYFETPKTAEAPFAWEIPLDRFRLDRGITVLEVTPGVYEIGRYFSYTDENALIAAGLDVFRGGYIYIVDDAKKAILIAAGIGITNANFTPAP
jgi:hypothetical protein